MFILAYNIMYNEFKQTKLIYVPRLRSCIRGRPRCREFAA